MSVIKIIGSRLENNNAYYIKRHKSQPKFKYFSKEQKTIKSDLADLKNYQMLLLDIKNAVLKLKPQWMSLTALMKYFWIETWISMHTEISGVTTKRTETVHNFQGSIRGKMERKKSKISVHNVNPLNKNY